MVKLEKIKIKEIDDLPECFLCKKKALFVYETTKGNLHNFCKFHGDEVKKYNWKFMRNLFE